MQGYHIETDVSDANASSYLTGSRSPTAYRLQLLDVQLSDTNPVLAPTVAGCGLTWVAVGTGVEYDTAGTRHAIFRFRALGAAPTLGQLTITATEAMSGCGWSWNEYDGIDTGGTNGSDAVVQTAVNNGVGTTLSLASPLAAFGSASNGVAVGFSTDADSVYTAGSGYTILGQDVSASASPTASIGQEWRADNDTSPDATIAVSATWGLIASELKAAAVVTPVTTRRTYGKPEVPETTVALATRGGDSVLAMLPFSALSYGRRLDDMGDATVTVATGDCTDALGVALGDVNPWEHELIVWRGASQVWVGPVNGAEWDAGGVTIRARDLFQWTERRQVALGTHLDRSADLAQIFIEWAVNGIVSTDNSMHMEFRAVTSGVNAQREVDNADYRYLSDELREMARTGVDWTTVGRELWVGPEDFIADIMVPANHDFWDEFGVVFASSTVTMDESPVSPTAPLITEHVDQARILRPPGVSRVTVRGAVASGDVAQPVGTAGGTDATLGRVEIIESDMSIRDAASAASAAANRLSLIGEETMTCRWLVDSSVRFWHLIPGAKIPVAVEVGCRTIDEDMRLLEVGVSVQGGDEVVTLRLGPVLD